MSNLDARLNRLERGKSDNRAYWITGNNGMVNVRNMMNAADTVSLSEVDFDNWQSRQPDSVVIIRIVYPDGTLAEGL